MKYNKWKIFILSCLCALASMMNVKYIRASEINQISYPKIGRLEIQKIDDETSSPINGAKLELWEDGNNIRVATWVSSDEKKKIDVDLNKIYILKEVQPAQGYEKADDIIIRPDKDTTIKNKDTTVMHSQVQYTGLRHDGVRYITDGVKFQAVYCLNEDYNNPNNITELNMFDTFNDKFPKYVNKTLKNIKGEELYNNQKYTFYKDGLANVLLEGYPTNISGLQDKYKLSNSEAYTITQNLIYAVLKNDLTEKATNTQIESINNMMKYYNELLKVYKEFPHKNARSYIDVFSWIPNTGRPENQDTSNTKYQMLVGVTNFDTDYVTNVISASKKKATSLEPNKFTVKKIWDDKGDVKHEKDVVRVQLYEQGKPVGGVVELRTDNGWTYTWDDITVKDNYDYELKELDVKLGYTSRVEYDDYNLVLRNTQVEGKVTITKTDEETKSPLPNAEFDITDEQGKLVKKVITNDEGKGSVDLHGGKYFVREVKAPKGYQVSDRSHEVVITKQDEHITLDITNKKEPDKILDEEEAVVEDNTRGDESSDIKHETTSENEEAQPEEDTVVNDRKDSEVKEENFADVDNGKQSEVVDENTSEKEENQSEEDIVVEDTKDLEIKDEASTDIDDRKEPEVKEEIVIEENVSSNGKGDKPKQENNDAIIVKEEQKVPLKKDIEKQAHQDETKNTKYSVMGQKKDSVKSEDKKESKINEKETVNTSDQTNTYMWWLVTASVILMIVCGCKYGLYKKSDK